MSKTRQKYNFNILLQRPLTSSRIDSELCINYLDPACHPKNLHGKQYPKKQGSNCTGTNLPSDFTSDCEDFSSEIPIHRHTQC
ncbi:hypothetical protein B9Z55_008991 [Caenorhabditis nigoni]|uniref:Uncharacterized protein n=1 Tax=Caenorhabditis nigoni TaxID=1611254 RepID=A0A2G5UQ16_9PELO|nr:hypothetical protein B9Z55_008991 [Caenorhabditis nigoni]